MLHLGDLQGRLYTKPKAGLPSLKPCNLYFYKNNTCIIFQILFLMIYG